jgi:hypothetical protein
MEKGFGQRFGFGGLQRGEGDREKNLKKRVLVVSEVL